MLGQNGITLIKVISFVFFFKKKRFVLKYLTVICIVTSSTKYNSFKDNRYDVIQCLPI